jgi:branched-subunit amino acid transport protein
MLLLADGAQDWRHSVPRVLAALVTLFVALRWRGYLLPLILGMLTMHAVQWLLRG